MCMCVYADTFESYHTMLISIRDQNLYHLFLAEKAHFDSDLKTRETPSSIPTCKYIIRTPSTRTEAVSFHSIWCIYTH